MYVYSILFMKWLLKMAKHSNLRLCMMKIMEYDKTISLVALPPNNIYVDPITEERASRCLARIDMLNKIRTETLNHPKLDDRVKLCQPSYDLPSWWICGQHDKDLLIGAAR